MSCHLSLEFSEIYEYCPHSHSKRFWNIITYILHIPVMNTWMLINMFVRPKIIIKVYHFWSMQWINTVHELSAPNFDDTDSGFRRLSWDKICPRYENVLLSKFLKVQLQIRLSLYKMSLWQRCYLLTNVIHCVAQPRHKNNTSHNFTHKLEPAITQDVMGPLVLSPKW